MEITIQICINLKRFRTDFLVCHEEVLFADTLKKTIVFLVQIFTRLFIRISRYARYPRRNTTRKCINLLNCKDQFLSFFFLLEKKYIFVCHFLPLRRTIRMRTFDIYLLRFSFTIYSDLFIIIYLFRFSQIFLL